jgi:hypothetical protein
LRRTCRTTEAEPDVWQRFATALRRNSSGKGRGRVQ